MANPLSLSVPDSVVLDSWLQDSGYLDHRTSTVSPMSPSSSAATEAKPPTALSAQLVAVFSLLTVNPLSKLSADDFSGDTPPWTTSFFGDSDFYSFPSSTHEARNRVHENVKRFARNYATLFILFFSYELFEMPVAFLGFVTSYAFWELFKFCVDRWESNRHPFIRKILIRVALCATVSFLAFLNAQIAVFYALAISYAVVLLHGGFRNLSLSENQS
ncbi:PRA1 family protein H [Raphanus sativus]|nr:PRA1 family protein H [Raphanus sativus]